MPRPCWPGNTQVVISLISIDLRWFNWCFALWTKTLRVQQPSHQALQAREGPSSTSRARHVDRHVNSRQWLLRLADSANLCTSHKTLSWHLGCKRHTLTMPWAHLSRRGLALSIHGERSGSIITGLYFHFLHLYCSSHEIKPGKFGKPCMQTRKMQAGVAPALHEFRIAADGGCPGATLFCNTKSSKSVSQQNQIAYRLNIQFVDVWEILGGIPVMVFVMAAFTRNAH